VAGRPLSGPSARRSLYGGILIAVGYLMLAATDARVFLRRSLRVVAGTGLLKPNISTIVGQIYGPSDPRRDSGFSIFYMGINVGATIAPLICGYVGQRINWHWASRFRACVWRWAWFNTGSGSRHLGDAGLHPVPPASPEEAVSQRRWLRYRRAGRAGGCGRDDRPASQRDSASHRAAAGERPGRVAARDCGSAVCLDAAGGDWTPVERKRLAAILVLFIAASLFWSAFEQAGSSLNLLRGTQHRTITFSDSRSRRAGSQSLNSFFIVAVAPLLAWLWLRLGTRQPSSPAQICVGADFRGQRATSCCCSAHCLSAGGAKGHADVPGGHLPDAHPRRAMSEPGRLSAITKLAPVRNRQPDDGCLVRLHLVGNYLGGRLASVYGTLPVPVLFGLFRFSISPGCASS